MSNNQMVSVPRELLERACMRPSRDSLAVNEEDIIGRGRAQAELREILAKPAEQHHGEPEVLPERWTRQHFPAYMSDDEAMVRVGTWNACLDEIAKLGPLYPRPVQGEPVGYCRAANIERMRDGQLSGFMVEDEKKGDVIVPLYNHADPAEVERLRDQLAAWQALAAERLEVATGLRAQAAQHNLAMDAACAEIAERDALLREVLMAFEPGKTATLEEFSALMDKVRLALPASAEQEVKP